MLLLDTDHLTVLRYREHSLHAQLVERLNASADPRIVVCVISLEEQLRGWLAEIRRRANDPLRQVPVYSQLVDLVDFYREWDVLPFNEAAVSAYQRLKTSKIRIGTQDLKIASIALVAGATVLTANLKDFEQVPNLKVEDWLHGKPRPPLPR